MRDTVVASWTDGVRRVLGAPVVLAGTFALTLLAAVPLAMALRASLAAHLGSSVAAELAATSVDFDWWQEFNSQASGIGATFLPAIIGFAATLDNLSSILDAEGKIFPVAAALGVYLLAWTFVSGGVLDRYARQRPTRAYGFFGAAGAFFWRFLRLAAMAGVVYWFLFSYVHVWLFDQMFRQFTRDLAVERPAFFLRVVLYAVFGTCLIATNVVFDYARIRLVVEDRRSVLGAIRAALGFIRRHPASVLGLYGMNALAFLFLMAVWAIVAPGVDGDGAVMWAALAVGQAYVLGRLFLKLQFMASQVALFQASLAHSAYTAAPAPRWPESPAAEAVADVV